MDTIPEKFSSFFALSFLCIVKMGRSVVKLAPLVRS